MNGWFKEKNTLNWKGTFFQAFTFELHVNLLGWAKLYVNSIDCILFGWNTGDISPYLYLVGAVPAVPFLGTPPSTPINIRI